MPRPLFPLQGGLLAAVLLLGAANGFAQLLQRCGGQMALYPPARVAPMLP